MAERKTSLLVKFAFFILMLCAGLFFPTTVLMMGGLLPTLIAAIVDDRPVRTAWLTVGAMNFAGLVPAIFDLWHVGHITKNAIEILMQPRTIILSYSAAAIGWFIYYQVPKIVTGFLVRRAKTRLKDIEKRRHELNRKWGPEVSH